MGKSNECGVEPSGDRCQPRAPESDSLDGQSASTVTQANAVALLDRLREGLERLGTPGEIPAFIRRARGLAELLKTVDAGREMEFRSAVLVLEAKCRAGVLLAKMQKNAGGRPRKTHDAAEVVSPPTLAEQEIGAKQSSKWQRLATVPEAAFWTYCEEREALGELPTEAGLLRVADRLQTKVEEHSVTGAGDCRPNEPSGEVVMTSPQRGHYAPVNPVCRGTATACPGVPDHRVISVVIGTNADLIAAVSALWIVDGDVVLDPTWGQGAFWRLGSPDGLIAHDLKTDGIDFRKLPEADTSVDVVVFDPPTALPTAARQRMDSPTPTD